MSSQLLFRHALASVEKRLSSHFTKSESKFESQRNWRVISRDRAQEFRAKEKISKMGELSKCLPTLKSVNCLFYGTYGQLTAKKLTHPLPEYLQSWTTYSPGSNNCHQVSLQPTLPRLCSKCRGSKRWLIMNWYILYLTLYISVKFRRFCLRSFYDIFSSLFKNK